MTSFGSFCDMQVMRLRLGSAERLISKPAIPRAITKPPLVCDAPSISRYANRHCRCQGCKEACRVYRLRLKQKKVA